MGAEETIQPGHGSFSRVAQYLGHRACQLVPVLFFFLELFAPGRGKPVELRLAVVVGSAPLGSNPAGLLDAMQRGIARPLVISAVSAHC